MANYGFGMGQKSKQDFENTDKYTVRCPHCQALFTLDVSKLTEHEGLRFRCSQCKVIFRAEEAEWQPCSAEPTTKKVISKTAAPSPSENSSTDPFDFSFDEKNSEYDFPTSALQGKQWNEDIGVDDWDIPQPTKTKEFDIMANLEKKIDLSAPKEVVQSKQNTASKGDTLETQIPLDFSPKPTNTRKSNEFSLDINPKVENFTYREPLQSSSSSITADIPNREPNRWFSTAVFAAPFLCLLLALGFASFYLTQTPFNDGGWLHSFLPSSQKVPPPGLILSDISFRRVPLQSGEIVHLISGTLQNHTERSFKEVILEGLGFDAGGQKISALKVNAGATLVKTRVESFSPEMIKELQGRESVRHFDLEPGDEQAFTLGLLSDEMNAAKYYSARIYSAN